MTALVSLRRWSVVLLPFVLAVAACGDAGPPTERATDGDATGQVREELFANDKVIYDYFVGKGLTGFQAAGIAGNLDQAFVYSLAPKCHM